MANNRTAASEALTPGSSERGDGVIDDASKKESNPPKRQHGRNDEAERTHSTGSRLGGPAGAMIIRIIRDDAFPPPPKRHRIRTADVKRAPLPTGPFRR
jgi:hypothetical protein